MHMAAKTSCHPVIRHLATGERHGGQRFGGNEFGRWTF